MDDSMKEVKVDIGGRTLSFRTGQLAEQAGGVCLAQYGETTVFATACSSDKPKKLPFLPLTIDVQEKSNQVNVV